MTSASVRACPEFVSALGFSSPEDQPCSALILNVTSGKSLPLQDSVSLVLSVLEYKAIVWLVPLTGSCVGSASLVLSHSLPLPSCQGETMSLWGSTLSGALTALRRPPPPSAPQLGVEYAQGIDHDKPWGALGNKYNLVQQRPAKRAL